MMKRLTLTLLAAAFLATGACSKKDGAASAIEKLTQLKDSMCACVDKACVDKVNAAYIAFGTSMEGKHEGTPDQASLDKIRGLMAAFQECATKAQGVGSGS